MYIMLHNVTYLERSIVLRCLFRDETLADVTTSFGKQFLIFTT